MPYFQAADGAKLHYTDAGSGSPPLVFIHGWCGRLEHWEPQARAFARTHRVVRVDLRGHGRSEAPPDSRYSRREFAEDVAALMRRLRLRNAVVVGHSMGGIIAPEVAWLARDRTAALVIVDAGFGWGMRAADIDAHEYIRGLAGEDWKAWLAGQLTGLLGLDDASHPRLRERIARDAARMPLHAVAGSIRNAVLAASPRWPRLGRMPVLYINSSREFMTQERIRRVLPHAEFGQAVGSGHWVQLEVPDQFNAMLRDFVGRVGAGR
jgi:pimeloyl-ACP methyl ester carboxylesterase